MVVTGRDTKAFERLVAMQNTKSENLFHVAVLRGPWLTQDT